MQELIEELGEVPYHFSTDLFKQCVRQLNNDPKVIIVDEIDYLTGNESAIETLRDEDTLNHYKTYVTSNLLHYFKKTRLNDITEEMLEDLKETLEDYRCSKREVIEQICLVRKIVQIYASDNNIFPSMRNLSSEFKKQINPLEKEQIHSLLNICKNESPDFYPLLVTALNTRLTRGEILALTWDKLDVKNKTLKIDKSICNKKIIKLRTKSAIRNIDLPDKIIEILLNLKKVSKSIFIFPDENGNLQDPDFMIKDKFLPLLTEAGLEKIKFIDLRDSYAMLLLEQNLPLTYVVKQMGISNIKDFVDKYNKFIPEIKRGNFCVI